MMIVRGIYTDCKGLPIVQIDQILVNALNNLPNGPLVLVIHWEKALTVLENLQNKGWPHSKFQQVQGILFLRSNSYAGVDPTKARAKEVGLKDRVHFLSYAVPEVEPNQKCDPTIGHRFEEFKNRIEQWTGGSIPWEILEPPPWPEDLVAAYLALVATEREVDVIKDIPPETWTKAQTQANELIETYGDGKSPAIGLGDQAQRQKSVLALRSLFQRISERQA